MLKKRLYRSLLRLSANMDRNPVLKAFVASDRRDVYDTISKSWINVDLLTEEKPDIVSKALRALARENCSGGMFYKPGQSLQSIVRKSFREPGLCGLKHEERLDLGLEALKYLSRCNNIGAKICFNPTVSKSSAEIGSETSAVHLRPTDCIEEGSLLIAHPLLYQCSLTQCCLVLAQHDNEKGSLGFVLNQPMNCTLGDKLSLETQRKYPYVKQFLSCPLYRGGEVMTPQPLTLLHRNDYLSFCSKKISIPSTEPSATSPSVGDGHGVESMRDCVSMMGGDSSMMLQSAESSNTLYYTQDLKTVSQEIAEGRVSVDDFKVVLGFAGWGVGQLQGEIDMNTWFIANGSSVIDLALWKGIGSSSSPDSAQQVEPRGQEQQEQTEQGGLSPLADGAKDCEHCEHRHECRDSSVSSSSMVDWGRGHTTWQQVLRSLGGEYAQFAQCADLTELKRDSATLKDLAALSLYGLDAVANKAIKTYKTDN